MQNLTPQQRRRLEKLLKVEQGGVTGILEYLFEIEEKIDEEIPQIKDIITRLKGDKGDNYVLTNNDKKDFVNAVRSLISDEEIAKKALDLINIDYESIAKNASKFIEVPKAESVNYNKIKKEVLADIIIPVHKDGIDADEDVIIDKVIDKLQKNLPQFGEAFRDGLEILSDNDRLDIKAIKGLDDYKEVSKLARDSVFLNRGGNGKGLISQMNDVSITSPATNDILFRDSDGLWKNTSKATFLSGYVPYTGANQALDLGANNLIVNTDTFFVDTVNNRVGVGTSSPSQKFTVAGTGVTSIKLLNATTQLDFGVGTSATFLQSRTIAGAATPFDFYVGNVSAINLSSTGSVGVGGVATGKFDVVAATNKSFRVREAVAANGGVPTGLTGLGTVLELTRPTDGAWATLAWFVVNNADAGYSARSNHRFYSNGAELVTLLENGNFGVNTNAARSKVHTYEPNETTVKSTFTGALTYAGYLIESDYTADAYMPGIFWSTRNSAATAPKAGVFLKGTATGTRMIFGTSNNYATGITNAEDIAPVIYENGFMGISLGTTVATALLDLAASTTARASLRIRTGAAPTTPNDGDIWQDGTNIKMRIGGVTKTFTLV